MNITFRKGDYIKLIAICSISIALDLFFFIDISSPPAWDQGYHLYSVLISQILQKKVKNAEITIDRILNFDFANGNTYLTKSIIKIYLSKPKEAQEVINKAKIFNKSSESKPILDILEGVVKIMNFKFLDAYQILS